MDVQDEDDIITKYVDRPGVGYAQFVAEIQTEGAATAGKVEVQFNMRDLLGGFVRFNGNAAEQQACATFKRLAEARVVGGARAVDPSREPVDGGWLNPEAVFEIGAEARKKYGEITEHLGRVDTDKLYFVVVGEWGPTPFAKHFFKQRYPDGNAVSQAKVEVRRIAAKLAAYLDLEGRARDNRRGVRAEGERATEFHGETSTRKV